MCIRDLTVEQTPRPHGHGYVEATVERNNPWFETGERLRGHEFHYSRPRRGPAGSATVLGLERGTGMGDGRDGIVSGRVWASYVHLHALGTPTWAPRLVALARAHRDERSELSAACG